MTLDKNLQTTLIALAVVVSAYIAYKWYRNKQANNTSTTTAGSSGTNLNSIAPELIGGSAGPNSGLDYAPQPSSVTVDYPQQITSSASTTANMPSTATNNPSPLTANTTTPASNTTATVTVPNVVGMQLDKAQPAITNAGLKFSGPGVTKGKITIITSESPKAGSKVAKGSTVTVKGKVS
jgi:PASTA domain